MNFQMIYLLIGFFATELVSQSQIPSFEEVKQNFSTSEFYILDKNQEKIQVLRKNPQERRLEWISLEEISLPILESVRIAEDKRFFEHKGVDWFALGDGVFRTLTFSSPRGASTISMQVAGILKEGLKKRRRNFFEKLTQIQLALELEKSWSKQQILETYLNLVPFRGELVGIHAASWGIFQKHPHSLNKLESLLLASMIKSPSFKIEKIIERACYLQKLQYAIEDCSKLNEIGFKFLTKPYFIKREENFAYHLGIKIFQRNKELQEFITTLDKNLQIQTLEFAKLRMKELVSQNVRDVGVLIVENSTGNILSYVGGLFEFSQTPYVDSVVAQRQAGSTLKPFLYAVGLEKKYFNLASLILDSPIQFNVGTGLYAPGNYGDRYFGYVTIKQALASSLNSPAVQVLEMIGLKNAHSKLEDLGFTSLKEADHYGYSMALGTVDVTLWDLVRAYLCFAREGECIDIGYTSQENRNKQKVFSKEVSFLITNTLSDRDARALGFGYNNPLSTKVPSAVKTGTSKDMRDNWCIGYTPNFTVGVWIGNHSGEPMWNVSGVSGAAFLWSDIIHFLYKNKKAEDFPIPKEVVQAKVRNEVFNINYKEWFLKGTEIENINLVQHQKINKIKTPVNNAIYAFDPDKSESSQILIFESSIPSSENFWRLNGKILTDSKKIYLWNIQRGHFILELVDSKLSTIDKIHFEVR